MRITLIGMLMPQQRETGTGAALTPVDQLESNVVPAQVLAAARAAFDVYDRTATTAGLTGDAYGCTDAGGVRMLTFAGGGREVRLSVVPEQDGQTVLDVEVVAAVPGTALEVEVRVRDEASVAVERLAASRWSVRPLPTGPVSVSVRTGSRVVNTEWTVLKIRAEDSRPRPFAGRSAVVEVSGGGRTVER